MLEKIEESIRPLCMVEDLKDDEVMELCILSNELNACAADFSELEDEKWERLEDKSRQLHDPCRSEGSLSPLQLNFTNNCLHLLHFMPEERNGTTQRRERKALPPKEERASPHQRRMGQHHHPPPKRERTERSTTQKEEGEPPLFFSCLSLPKFNFIYFQIELNLTCCNFI